MEPLDEDVAWALVRAARAAATSKPLSPPARVTLPDRPEVWLEIARSAERSDGPSGGASGGPADGPAGDQPDASEVQWCTSGPPGEAARDLLDLYLPLVLARDLVIGQLGQSLDGRIATEAGHSHYVTGRADIERLHRLRALADAVVVGNGTVASDDPRLTVREVDGENPVRVVLDPDARLPTECRVLTDGQAQTLVLRRATAASLATDVRQGARHSTTDAHAHEVLVLPAGPEGFEPRAVLDALRARGLRRVLVEGGGITVSRFLQAGELDRLHVCVAPLLIGSGRAALTLQPVASLKDALRPRCRHFHLGEDLLFDLDLR